MKRKLPPYTNSQIAHLIDELMESLQVMHPRLYEGVMRKLG